jgi:anti-anti-sigma regulatory factor
MRDGDSTIVSWSWRSDRTIVLKPCGEIEGARAQLLRAVVRRAMAQTSRRVVIDMSHVTTPDRETTALLATLQRDAFEARTRLELVGLVDHSDHHQRRAVAGQR